MVVTLATPCANKPELLFEYGKHQRPFKRDEFEALRAGLYFVDLGVLRMVPSKGVTVWAHTPGSDTFYPYPHALTRRRTTHIEIPCLLR